MPLITVEHRAGQLSTDGVDNWQRSPPRILLEIEGGGDRPFDARAGVCGYRARVDVAVVRTRLPGAGKPGPGLPTVSRTSIGWWQALHTTLACMSWPHAVWCSTSGVPSGPVSHLSPTPPWRPGSDTPLDPCR